MERAARLLDDYGEAPEADQLGPSAVMRRSEALADADADEYWEDEREAVSELLRTGRHDARVNPAVKLEDAYCLDCDEDEIYMGVKEEPSAYKVGAVCNGCDRDYGVLESVPRSEIDHLDELGAEAEDVVRRYLD